MRRLFSRPVLEHSFLIDTGLYIKRPGPEVSQKHICKVTVASERIVLPLPLLGKNDRLEAGTYNCGLPLEGNLAKIQKGKQRKGKLTW